MRLRTYYRIVLLSLLTLIAGIPLSAPTAVAQSSSQLFPETGKRVGGRFYQYWQQHGGLAQQGYPISDQMQERSDTDGKTYTVQYFERAVFEQHPENQPPNDVLLSLLGNFLYAQKYPSGAPDQHPNTSAGSMLFKETGKRVGGIFLAYWQQHGGLAQQGYPISDEFTERSELDGKTYTVQYFERAVFELHPENQPPYNVLLSQLGTFRYTAKYGQNPPPASPPYAIPTPVAGCKSNLTPGTWQGPLQWQYNLTTDKGVAGNGAAKADLSLVINCDGSFTGTATVTSFTTNGLLGTFPVLTCSASQTPVAEFAGVVAARVDGLYFVVPGGRWRSGAVSCTNPATNKAPDVTDLTGKPIAPADIKIESYSQGKIAGSQWFPDLIIDIVKAKVHEYVPSATIQVTSTGTWELDYQTINTP